MAEIPHNAAIAETMQSLPQPGLPDYLQIAVADTGPGFMSCTVDVRPELLNPFGSLHGGVISALIDHVLGAVCYPAIPPGSWAATTEFKVNLISPVREGTVVARAEIVAMTARTAVVRVDVSNHSQPVAFAQGTVMIKAPRT